MDADAADAAGPGLGPEDLPGLGARLRERRLRSGLTLEAAAARVGLSPAHLSRLETAKRQPSLPVLLGLSRAYAVPLDVLLGEASAAPSAVIRGGSAEPSLAGGWTYRPAGAPGRAMQALRVHVPPDIQDAVVRVHPGEEWLYVLSGRLVLTLDRERHLLEPGDSAHFDSMRPHRLAADTPTGTDLLFLHTLLQSPTSELCLG
ncbi:helix-turn-helix domain-containing protein [Streptacidiphilus neutrinimicus]|uniref:helix-turn-helix domain-containing protein n=1 Tax=Streptacidiphilus neutrinimicus TaxID=105420 RepID=UPI0005A5D55C|nr:XRE family transcriptional regulator [Streptacidiphilus neutrinimicus]